MHPVIRRQILRIARPYLPEIMETLQQAIQQYKQEVTLEEGETHAAGVIHEQQGEVFLVISAFQDNLVTRKVKVIPLKDIITLIQND